MSCTVDTDAEADILIVDSAHLKVSSDCQRQLQVKELTQSHVSCFEAVAVAVTHLHMLVLIASL